MTYQPVLRAAVARKLGHYVYMYVDPRTDTPIYVGKGKGRRLLAHAKSTSRKALTRTIARIRAEGLEPKIEILTHDLPSEEAAFQVERAVIDALGLDNLENRVRGWRSRLDGRALLQDLIARYAPRRVPIREPVMVIRLTRDFRSDMSPVELYDATRSAWKLGSRRSLAKYAFAVYEGVVREVYEITSWHVAGSTFNTKYEGRRGRPAGRHEFVGTLASDSVRRRYINSHVGHLFRPGAVNPITYVNCARDNGRSVR